MQTPKLQRAASKAETVARMLDALEFEISAIGDLLCRDAIIRDSDEFQAEYTKLQNRTKAVRKARTFFESLAQTLNRR